MKEKIFIVRWTPSTLYVNLCYYIIIPKLYCYYTICMEENKLLHKEFEI